MPSLFKQSPSGFTQENPVCISHLSRMCHEHCPSIPYVPRALPIYPICATSTAHLMLVHLVIPLTSGEEYKSCSSSFIFSYPPAISTLLASNILLGILFSNTTMSETKFHTHTKQMIILNFVYLNMYVFRKQM